MLCTVGTDGRQSGAAGKLIRTSSEAYGQHFYLLITGTNHNPQFYLLIYPANPHTDTPTANRHVHAQQKCTATHPACRDTSAPQAALRNWQQHQQQEICASQHDKPAVTQQPRGSKNIIDMPCWGVGDTTHKHTMPLHTLNCTATHCLSTSV